MAGSSGKGTAPSEANEKFVFNVSKTMVGSPRKQFLCCCKQGYRFHGLPEQGQQA